MLKHIINFALNNLIKLPDDSLCSDISRNMHYCLYLVITTLPLHFLSVKIYLIKKSCLQQKLCTDQKILSSTEHLNFIYQ